MASLQNSISMRSRSSSGPKTVAPETGLDIAQGTSGRGGLSNTIKVKNRGVVPSPGVEKSNSAS